MSDKINGIKAVLIDVDNTLLDFYKSVPALLDLTFKQVGLVFKSDYMPTFLQINEDLWDKEARGVITREQLIDVRFNTFLDAVSLKADGREMEKIFRFNLRSFADEIDGAKGLLEYLSQKYDLYIASNSLLIQQEMRLKKADMLKYVKDIFVSETAGAGKPKTQFFDYCFSRINQPKEAVVMIGDSLYTDVLGGMRYGLKTIWFNKDKKPLEGGIEPTSIVYSLNEIKNIL